MVRKFNSPLDWVRELKGLPVYDIRSYVLSLTESSRFAGGWDFCHRLSLKKGNSNVVINNSIQK